MRARAFRPDAVLSLISPGKEALRFEARSSCCGWRTSRTTAPAPPTAAHATLISTFLAASAKRVAIHCHAGVSRSTAAALALLHLRGLPPKALAPTLQAIRPQARSNRRLAYLLDHVLGLPGTIFAAVLHSPLLTA